MTIEINVKGFPTSNSMFWHFLVEMDVGPIFFCINLVHCVHMKAEKTILAQENTFKIDLSIWQLLGLESTLHSELPHTYTDIPSDDCLPQTSASLQVHHNSTRCRLKQAQLAKTTAL